MQVGINYPAETIRDILTFVWLHRDEEPFAGVILEINRHSAGITQLSTAELGSRMSIDGTEGRRLVEFVLQTIVPIWFDEARGETDAKDEDIAKAAVFAESTIARMRWV